MVKKAVLRFSGFEYRYQEEYGIMPDYDFDRLVGTITPYAEAVRIWQGRIDTVWAKLKYEHEHKDEIEHLRLMEELERECPF